MTFVGKHFQGTNKYTNIRVTQRGHNNVVEKKCPTEKIKMLANIRSYNTSIQDTKYNVV